MHTCIRDEKIEFRLPFTRDTLLSFPSGKVTAYFFSLLYFILLFFLILALLRSYIYLFMFHFVWYFTVHLLSLHFFVGLIHTFLLLINFTLSTFPIFNLCFSLNLKIISTCLCFYFTLSECLFLSRFLFPFLLLSFLCFTHAYTHTHTYRLSLHTNQDIKASKKQGFLIVREYYYYYKYI